MRLVPHCPFALVSGLRGAVSFPFELTAGRCNECRLPRVDSSGRFVRRLDANGECHSLRSLVGDYLERYVVHSFFIREMKLETTSVAISLRVNRPRNMPAHDLAIMRSGVQRCHMTHDLQWRRESDVEIDVAAGLGSLIPDGNRHVH